MIQVLTVIAPLFLIIFAVALLNKFKNIGESWAAVLNEYALKIGLPVLIFSSLIKASFSLKSEAPLIIVNSLFILICLGLTYRVGKMLRLTKQTLHTFFLCICFGNVAYLGIPTLTQVYGNTILPTASLIVAVYLFWMFSVGTGYLEFTQCTSKRDVIKSIGLRLGKNPLLLSVLLGLVVSGFKIQIPSIMLKSLDMITASVTPTVLIVIGLFIGKSKLGKLREWIPVALFSLITLVAVPGLLYLGLSTLGSETKDYASSIIQAAMPLAITPFALAEKFMLDKVMIARSIVLSTILSVTTLPFWISILQ